MNSLSYYLLLGKKIKSLMTPNKLYNARQLRKLLLYNNIKLVDDSVLGTTLKYVRTHEILLSDTEYGQVIIYWTNK